MTSMDQNRLGTRALSGRGLSIGRPGVLLAMVLLLIAVVGCSASRQTPIMSQGLAEAKPQATATQRGLWFLSS